MKTAKKILPFVIFVVLFFLQSCTGVSSDSKLDVIKKLMDREAQKTAVDLLGVTYNSKESKVITAKEMNEWIKSNKIDVTKFPVNVQKAINDKSTLALFVPKFIPIKDKKASVKAYDIGGIYLPLFPYDDFGGWWIGGGDCDVRCEKCRGCKGPNNLCYCSMVCCTRCDSSECWPCQICAKNP
jgi:hypothetical protein